MHTLANSEENEVLAVGKNDNGAEHHVLLVPHRAELIIRLAYFQINYFEEFADDEGADEERVYGRDYQDSDRRPLETRQIRLCFRSLFAVGLVV